MMVLLSEGRLKKMAKCKLKLAIERVKELEHQIGMQEWGLELELELWCFGSCRL